MTHTSCMTARMYRYAHVHALANTLVYSHVHTHVHTHVYYCSYTCRSTCPHTCSYAPRPVVLFDSAAHLAQLLHTSDLVRLSQACLCTCLYTCLHTVRMNINTSNLVRLLQACPYPCLYTCLYTCLNTRLYACLYACPRTYIYTCLYTCLSQHTAQYAHDLRRDLQQVLPPRLARTHVRTHGSQMWSDVLRGTGMHGPLPLTLPADRLQRTTEEHARDWYLSIFLFSCRYSQYVFFWQQKS